MGFTFNQNFSDGYQFGDITRSILGVTSASNALNNKGSNSSSTDSSSAKSFEEWYGSNPYSLGSRIDNFFTGKVSSAQQAYQNYLSDYEYRRNAEASAKANQETWAREDSQIQRLLEDYQKAGINPYMLLNGGNISGGVVSSQSQKPSYKKKALEEGKVDDRLMSTAIKILALLLLKKAK